MTKDNVINLLPQEYEAALKEFSENGKLSVFLQCLSALAKTNFADDRFVDAWVVRKDSVVSDAPLDELLIWLASNQFVVEQEIKDIKPSSDPAISHAVNLYIELENFRSHYIKTLMNGKDNTYARIPSAYQFCDQLRSAFGDDDPAKVIAKYYLALFHNTNATQEVSQCLSNRKVLSFITDTVTTWAITEERSLQTQRKRSSDTCTSVMADCRLSQLDSIEPELTRLVLAIAHGSAFAENNSHLVNLRNLVILLPYLPQSAFERLFDFLCSAFDKSGVLDKDNHGFGIFIDIVTALPLGKPFPRHSDWVQESRIDVESYLSTVQIDIYPSENYPFLPVPLLSRVFWLVSNTRGHILSDASESTHANNGTFTTIVLRKRIHSLLDRIIDMKRTDKPLIRSIREQEWNDIGFSLDVLADYFEMSPPYILEMCLSVDREGGNIFPLDRSLDLYEGLPGTPTAEKWFSRTYRAALEDGLHELANALLAYFIFMQTIRCRGDFHADWSCLGEMIASAYRYPGEAYVKKSLAFAASRASMGTSPNHTIDLHQLVLSSWVKNQKQAGNVGDVNSVLNLDRLQLEHDLQRDVGKENWFKIRPETMVQLVDAKAHWFYLHSQVGRGHKDFGAIANAFGKAIEGELAHHLESVGNTELYRNWRQTPEKHMMLGAMLHLLKKYPQLPMELRSLIDQTGIKVHENPQLIQKLFTILKLRNEGSHPAPFHLREVEELMSLLFEKRLLRDLFNALPPITSPSSNTSRTLR